MENTPTNEQAGNAVQQSKATDNSGADRTVNTMVLQCSIRRKSTLIGLPGTNPNDRIYKIGSALDATTKKSLKGVTDAVEKKFMPSIIGVAPTDNNFQNLVNEYWANISVFIPADDPTMKAEDQGKVLKIRLEVTGSKLKEAIENEIDIVAKLELINKYIAIDRITVTETNVADFILLCYAVKYSRVAKDISLVNMSPKIFFYIYNKSTATKIQMTSIELRTKAINAFNELTDNEDKLNQLLVMFNLLPTSYESKEDKLIALDFEYNRTPENLKRFVDYANDKNLELKYLILYATKKGKLSNPTNTESFYYNQIPIGATLNEAILYLGNESNSEAVAIRETLKKEIK